MRRVGVARRWWLVGALAWGAGLLAPEAPTAPARASELPTFNVQLRPRCNSPR